MKEAWIFDREQELQTLKQRLSQHKAFLFHGPSGVGKTLLLQRVLPDFPRVLYCSESSSSQAMFGSLAADLLTYRDPILAGAIGRAGSNGIASKSAVSVKGLVMNALHAGSYLIVLDHLQRPSQAFAAAVREVRGWGNTPVIAVARSSHMEDAGFLLPFFPDRSEKLELRNFDPKTAEQFARHVMQQEGLRAENISEFSERVLEVSRGNPRAIVSLVRMARQPKYLAGDHIKIAPLYIDFRLNW